jgi:hypothetical protein
MLDKHLKKIYLYIIKVKSCTAGVYTGTKKTSMQNLIAPGMNRLKMHKPNDCRQYQPRSANGTCVAGMKDAPDTLHIDVFPSQGFLG